MLQDNFWCTKKLWLCCCRAFARTRYRCADESSGSRCDATVDVVLTVAIIRKTHFDVAHILFKSNGRKCLGFDRSDGRPAFQIRNESWGVRNGRRSLKDLIYDLILIVKGDENVRGFEVSECL